MKNLEMSITGDVLTIKVNLKKEYGISKSGKSVIIASTEGNVALEGREAVKLGINIYRAAE